MENVSFLPSCWLLQRWQMSYVKIEYPIYRGKNAKCCSVSYSAISLLTLPTFRWNRCTQICCLYTSGFNFSLKIHFQAHLINMLNFLTSHQEYACLSFDCYLLFPAWNEAAHSWGKHLVLPLWQPHSSQLGESQRKSYFLILFKQVTIFLQRKLTKASSIFKILFLSGFILKDTTKLNITK